MQAFILEIRKLKYNSREKLNQVDFNESVQKRHTTTLLTVKLNLFMLTLKQQRFS